MTAVISTLRFYKVLKADLAGHKPLSKLFAFKLMVGLNFLMNVSDDLPFLTMHGFVTFPLTQFGTFED